MNCDKCKQDPCECITNEEMLKRIQKAVDNYENLPTIKSKHEMQIIEGNNFVYFDVDDTLVVWDDKYKLEDWSNVVGIPDPHSATKDMIFLVPHIWHINYLKKSKQHGCTIVVWSAGGWDWAKAVVEALGLTEYVDAVMSKPARYVDDLGCKEFMGERIYTPYRDRYTTPSL